MVQSETPRRAALVTGGARGIGRAACLALAAEGMDIAVNYAGSAAAAEQTAADCRALGVQAVALQADVRRPEDVAAAIAFLAGERAGYITGQLLCIDGGMGM